MPLTLATHWESVRLHLQNRIPAASFNTWFRHTTLESLDGDQAIIGVASHFIKERLRDHYLNDLQSAFYSVTGMQVSINFRIASEPFQKLREEQKKADQAAAKLLAGSVKQATKATSDRLKNILNPNFNFDSFRAGRANQIALSACQRLAEGGATFSPLVIVGGTGLGKTHLLQAICRFIQEDEEQTLRPLYLPCEGFGNRFLKAVADGKRADFQRAMRIPDVFILDDIQFMAQGKKIASQEELLHTLDALQTAGKSVVISCDQDPRYIEGLLPRLSKRLISGFVVELEQPDSDTCQAIAESKAQRLGLELNSACLQLIQQRVEPCGRELEGAVSRLQAIAELQGDKITPSFIDLHLKQTVTAPENPSSAPVEISDVLSACASTFGLTVEDLTGRKRVQPIKNARKVAMILSRQITGASFPEIGRCFGNRSHATILQTIRDGERFIESTPLLKDRVRQIRRDFPHLCQKRLMDDLA